jgi:pyruvate formate lyase activating enzyme
MKIGAIIPESTIDYPGKIGPVIFTSGCNYRCPTCHNSQLIGKQISQESFEKFMKNIERKTQTRWYNGITICGGEPTLEPDLPEFLKAIKGLGLPVKLDTNGTHYRTLGELIQNKLVDYVALDIKGSPSIYGRITGFENESEFDIREGIEKAIGVIQHAPDYEFRTTVVPVFRDRNRNTYSWITPEEIRDMSNWVAGLIPGGHEKIKWYVQKFEARSSKDMMDPKFSKENLPKEYHHTPDKLAIEYRDILRKNFPKAGIR